jgi:hypothetical protein
MGVYLQCWSVFYCLQHFLLCDGLRLDCRCFLIDSLSLCWIIQLAELRCQLGWRHYLTLFSPTSNWNLKHLKGIERHFRNENKPKENTCLRNPCRKSVLVAELKRPLLELPFWSRLIFEVFIPSHAELCGQNNVPQKCPDTAAKLV